MEKIIDDINTAILKNGVSALKHCITKYMFGEHKIINLLEKNDEEKLKFIKGLEQELILSYELHGKSGIEIALNKYGIK